MGIRVVTCRKLSKLFPAAWRPSSCHFDNMSESKQIPGGVGRDADEHVRITTFLALSLADPNPF